MGDDNVELSKYWNPSKTCVLYSRANLNKCEARQALKFEVKASQLETLIF